MNLLIVTLDPTDGAAIVRVDPFHTLKKQGFNVNIRVLVKASFDDVAWSDIVYIHRAIEDEHLAIALNAKRLSKKLWIDVDDDILNIAPDNPVFYYYQRPNVRHAITRCIELADVLTVSSPYLYGSYKTLNNNCVFIECAYNEELFRLKKAPLKNRKKIISWRGSNTHQKSLLEYADAIVEVQNKHPDWEWCFVGMNPWWIIERFAECPVIVSDFLQPAVFLNFMAEKQPLIHFVALTDNIFTKCRSNSAYFDATIGNAVCYAKDWDHWKKPGIVNYRDRFDFARGLDQLMTDFDNGENYNNEIEKALDHILNNYTFSLANEKRIKILNELGSN